MLVAWLSYSHAAMDQPETMSSDKDKTSDPERREGVAVKERQKTKKPPMYKVLLHNDDYTTKEFVVLILNHIFRRSDAESHQIMMHVHNNGVGVAGVYTFEVAETKVEKTMQLAKRYEYPLQLSLEPESDGD